MGDATYKKRFGITTPIKYLERSKIHGDEKQFNRLWKRVYNRTENTLSETRMKSFDRCLKRVQKEGDEYLCKRIDIRYISKKIGYGAFAKVNIAPYTVLGFYTGIFTRNQLLPDDTHSTFEFTDFTTYSLAAEKAGNWCRFMNHSSEGDPRMNVLAWEYFRPEMPYIFFTSGRKPIKKGTQLLYTYGDQYWQDEKFASL